MTLMIILTILTLILAILLIYGVLKNNNKLIVMISTIIPLYALLLIVLDLVLNSRI